MFASENLSVTSSPAVGFTASKYAPSGTPGRGVRPADFAQAVVETAPVRWLADGSTPTASVGTLANPGDVIRVDGNLNITQFKAIAVAATASLDCQYGH